MKEKIKKYWWIIFILIIIGGAFYWFQWRPSQIRKECFQEVLRDVGGNIDVIGTSGVFQNRYNACLAKNGLEK